MLRGDRGEVWGGRGGPRASCYSVQVNQRIFRNVGPFPSVRLYVAYATSDIPVSESQLIDCACRDH
jgi:hypothetical protein